MKVSYTYSPVANPAVRSQASYTCAYVFQAGNNRMEGRASIV